MGQSGEQTTSAKGAGTRIQKRNRDAILDAVTGPGGCQSCHSMGSCAQYCPNGLNPMASIAGLKRAATRRALGGK